MPQKSHATISKQALQTLMEEYAKKEAEKADAREDYRKHHPEDSRGQLTPRAMRKAGTLSASKADGAAMVQRKAVNESDPDTDWTDTGQQKRWGDPDEYGKGVAKKKAKKK